MTINGITRAILFERRISSRQCTNNVWATVIESKHIPTGAQSRSPGHSQLQIVWEALLNILEQLCFRYRRHLPVASHTRRWECPNQNRDGNSSWRTCRKTKHNTCLLILKNNLGFPKKLLNIRCLIFSMGAYSMCVI